MTDGLEKIAADAANAACAAIVTEIAGKKRRAGKPRYGEVATPLTPALLASPNDLASTIGRMAWALAKHAVPGKVAPHRFALREASQGVGAIYHVATDHEASVCVRACVSYNHRDPKAPLLCVNYFTGGPEWP